MNINLAEETRSADAFVDKVRRSGEEVELWDTFGQRTKIEFLLWAETGEPCYELVINNNSLAWTHTVAYGLFLRKESFGHIRG